MNKEINNFTDEKLKKLKCSDDIKKRIQLNFWLMSPMQAVSDKYPKEVLELHNKFNEQFIKSLLKVRSVLDYKLFIEEQKLRAEQSENKIAAVLHPQKRREQGLEPLEEADIYNVCNILGEPLKDLFKMDLIWANISLKTENDLFNVSVGDQSNFKAASEYFDKFYKGCKWAIEDNNKVANNLSKYNTNKNFDDFIKDNGFTYIRYPNIHLEQKQGFLGYLYKCSEIIAKTYGLSQNMVGFKQDGLELFTTKSSEAYYVPSLKNINLRLDMINAFFHEHFHSLDHQIMININLDEIKNMYGRRGELKFSLASELKLVEPEKITDSPSKEILMNFNSITDKLISEKEYSQEEQEQRKDNILKAVQRFLEEIPQKLNMDKSIFEPTINDILIDFTNIDINNKFELEMENKLLKLTQEYLLEQHENYLIDNPDMTHIDPPSTPFKASYANYYVSMVKKIHALYNNMNNNTLFYNYSFINDNNRKGGYFASKPEMLARTAESYFFNKYPELNITPPEWWENNSYLFYPQNEELKMVADIFEKTADAIKVNSNAFEKNIGKENKKKIYML